MQGQAGPVLGGTRRHRAGQQHAPPNPFNGWSCNVIKTRGMISERSEWRPLVRQEARQEGASIVALREMHAGAGVGKAPGPALCPPARIFFLCLRATLAGLDLHFARDDT